MNSAAVVHQFLITISKCIGEDVVITISKCIGEDVSNSHYIATLSFFCYNYRNPKIALYVAKIPGRTLHGLYMAAWTSQGRIGLPDYEQPFQDD